MYISDKNAKYLEIIRDIYEVSLACGIKTYIWGGLTIDILEGKFLRDHHDIDGFTENLLDNLEELSVLYKQKGYETEFLAEVHMLKIKRGDLHAVFNRLDIDDETAMWRHIGDHGTVYFPAEWLDKEPRDFCGIKAYSAGPLFDYAIKTNPGLLSPDWEKNPREKDKVAKAYLEKYITQIGIKDRDIMSRIWSYNPYFNNNNKG